MRRYILTLTLLVLSYAASAQQSEASELLHRLDATLGQRYMVSAHYEQEDIPCYYMVDGDSYYISLGIMEVYSDGELRYEINNERKEIVEDRVNLLSEDILTNPTRVFAYFDKEFEVRGITHQGSLTTIDLAPRNPDLMGDYSVSLTVERTERGVEPRHLYYDYDGYVVDLALEVLHQSDAEFRHWKEHKMEYRAYDMISFL